MEKTPFSGISVLGPEDSIQSDNAAFISRDRREIDRALEIGARLHRHDGGSGLANPLPAPSGLVVASGGMIPAGISLSLGYTLEDAFGGETELSPVAIVTTQLPLDVPTAEPTAEVSYAAGSLDTDTFSYAVSWTDGEGGETPTGPSVLVTRDPGFANAEVKLSSLNAGMAEAGATAWRLYRARSGGEFVRLAEGTGPTYTDDGTVEPQCDVHPPTFGTNTTNDINQLLFTIPGSAAIGQVPTWINLYASQAGDFAESCLLAQVPAGSAGATAVFDALELLDAQPPDVNRSYDHAHKIDPDTELLDWHWKRPVTGSGQLPVGDQGDVRLVEQSGLLYGVLGGSAGKPQDWTALGSGVAAAATLSASGGAVNVEEVQHLLFAGSGGTSVAVTKPSAHTALITVNASGAAGPPGKEGEPGPAGPAGPAGAAIEIDAVSHSSAGTGTLTWTHTQVSGAPQGLLVIIAADPEGITGSVTEVRCGTAKLDKPVNAIVGPHGAFYCYFLSGPEIPTGLAHTIEVVVSGTWKRQAVAISLTGPGPLRVSQDATNEETTTTPSVTTANAMGESDLTFGLIGSTVSPVTGAGMEKLFESILGTTHYEWDVNKELDQGEKPELHWGTAASGTWKAFLVSVGLVRDFGRVTALPTTKGIGDTCTFIADEADGVHWRFEWDGEWWNKIGGPPLFEEVATNQSRSGTAYGNMTTVGPQQLVPLAGDYDITIGALIWGSVANESYATATVESGVELKTGFYIRNQTTNPTTLSRKDRVTGLTKGSNVVMQYKASTGSINAQWRYMYLDPIRVK